MMIYVGGWPRTKGSVTPRRGGRAPEYQDRESKDWAARVQYEAERAAARSGWERVATGPVSVHLVYWLPLDDVTVPGAGQGDVDKLERNILDALTAAGIYADDRQVVRVVHEKWPHVPARNVMPGVQVQVFRGRV